MKTQLENRPRTDADALLAEYEIFVAVGYITQNSSQRVREYDVYPASEFIVAGHEGQIVGISRIIRSDPSNGGYHFPTLNDFPEIEPRYRSEILSTPPEQLFEFGTIGIRPRFRGRAILQQMINHFVTQAVEQGGELCLASIDEDVFKLLRRVGYPAKAIGNAQFYMGSVTIPAIFRWADYR